MTHVFVGKLIIIGSDNGLPPDRHQAIIWTNAGLLSIGPLRTYFSENLMSSVKWRPSYLGLNVLRRSLWSIVLLVRFNFYMPWLIFFVWYFNFSQILNLIYFSQALIYPRFSRTYFNKPWLEHMAFLNTKSLKTDLICWFRFNWSLFLSTQLILRIVWFRQCLGDIFFYYYDKGLYEQI